MMCCSRLGFSMVLRNDSLHLQGEITDSRSHYYVKGYYKLLTMVVPSLNKYINK